MVTSTETKREARSYSDLYPGRFLKADQLMGAHVTLTIRAAYLDRLGRGDGAEDRGVLAFKETGRELVLNKINGECLRAMFGNVVAEWVGKRVTLYPSKDRFGSEQVDCIRVSGSPDIDGPIQVRVRYTVRKPVRLTMTKTERKEQ